MKKYRNPYGSIEVVVGRLKPLNEGTYSRKDIEKNYLLKQKIYPRQGEYYFTKKF